MEGTLAWNYNALFQVEVVEGVAGEEDHHDEQEEHGEENAEAEGQHDEHDEDGTYNVHHAHYCLDAQSVHQNQKASVESPVTTIWETCVSRDNPRVSDYAPYKRRWIKLQITHSRQVREGFYFSLSAQGENTKVPKDKKYQTQVLLYAWLTISILPFVFATVKCCWRKLLEGLKKIA